MSYCSSLCGPGEKSNHTQKNVENPQQLEVKSIEDQPDGMTEVVAEMSLAEKLAHQYQQSQWHAQ